MVHGGDLHPRGRSGWFPARTDEGGFRLAGAGGHSDGSSADGPASVISVDEATAGSVMCRAVRTQGPRTLARCTKDKAMRPGSSSLGDAAVHRCTARPTARIQPPCTGPVRTRHALLVGPRSPRPGFLDLHGTRRQRRRAQPDTSTRPQGRWVRKDILALVGGRSPVGEDRLDGSVHGAGPLGRDARVCAGHRARQPTRRGERSPRAPSRIRATGGRHCDGDG